MNMTYVQWRRGLTRRGEVRRALGADDQCYGATCLLCDRTLGGDGPRAVPIQFLVVGPAEGDTDAQIAHDSGHWYGAAALVVHQPCLASRDDQWIEQFAAGLRMTPFQAGGTGAVA